MKSSTSSIRFNRYTFSSQSSHVSSVTSIKSLKRHASTQRKRRIPSRLLDVDNIGAQFNIQQLDDWYKVDPRATGHKNRVALPKILAEKYPEHNWLPWKFEHYGVPKGYWLNVENQRLFLDWAGKKLGVQKMEDWYSIEGRQIIELKGGSTILHQQGGLVQALKAIYPDYDWKPEKFEQKHSGFWHDMSHQRQFVEELGKKFGIQTLDDWYHVGVSKFQKAGGAHLINMYNCSMLQLLSAIYPDHNWIPWKFGRCPSGYWDNKDNLRAFFDALGEELGIKKLEDWYQVRYIDLFRLKKHFLLTQKFNNSLYLALCHVYPEFRWVPWYFEKAPKLQAWKDPKLVQQLMYEAAEKLHIVALDDWYRVSRRQLEDLKMKRVLVAYGGLLNLLKLAYPQHSWDLQKLGKSHIKKSSQRWLVLMVHQLFPGLRRSFIISFSLFRNHRRL